MALYVPLLSPLLRCVRIHTRYNKPPQYRDDTGQKYRLIGDRCIFTGDEQLDYGDNEDELIGAANWWTNKHPHGQATVYTRQEKP